MSNSKSTNAIYKEFIGPYYPAVSFKEFSSHFMKMYEEEKALGYPEDSTIWLNDWFMKNGTKFIESAKNQKEEKEPELIMEKVESFDLSGENIKTPVQIERLIFGVKPVFAYTGIALVIGFAIAGTVTLVKNSKKQ